MRDPIRRAAAVLTASTMILVAVACDTAGPANPTAPPTGSLATPIAGSPSASGGQSGAPSPTAPALTPVPGGTLITPHPGPGSTTETDWGTIRDALPITFPVYPGAHEADPIEQPASGAFSIGDDPQSIATWYQAALETAGFSTLTMSGPFEDGRIVIDSVGDPTTCRVQTTIRPLSGTVHVSVLYGADCPA
jgi:hypothetical protein